MSSALYEPILVDNSIIEDWDKLVCNSKQNSPFLEDKYLDIVGFFSEKYIVYRKGKPYAGICIPVNKKTGESSCAVPFAPFQGLVYSSSKDTYTDYHNNLEATGILLDYLFAHRKHNSLSFANS